MSEEISVGCVTCKHANLSFFAEPCFRCFAHDKFEPKQRQKQHKRMTIPEAIEVLKTESCYECAYGCKSPYSCAVANCPLKDAVITAIKCMEE